jgi:recombinational DNA repair protein (RecF pathway)
MATIQVTVNYNLKENIKWFQTHALATAEIEGYSYDVYRCTQCHHFRLPSEYRVKGAGVISVNCVHCLDRYKRYRQRGIDVGKYDNDRTTNYSRSPHVFPDLVPLAP